jgi:hypothetical protein
VRARQDEQSLAIGRPLVFLDAAWQVGEASGLAAVKWQQVDLLEVLPLLRVAGGRLLLDLQPPIRQERQCPTIGGVPRLRVVAGTDRQTARLAPIGVDRPDRVAIAVLARADGLKAEGDARAVGRGSVATRRRYRSSGRNGRVVDRVNGRQPPNARLGVGRRGAARGRGFFATGSWPRRPRF